MKSKTNEELLKENLDLKLRLNEAEDTLNAIQNGEVDVIINSHDSVNPQVYTLESADYLYRNLVQEMNEGVATLTNNGTIFYSNAQLATILEIPLEKITGYKLIDFIHSTDIRKYNSIFDNELPNKRNGEINLKSVNGNIIPVHISIKSLNGLKGVYVVVTDLSEQKLHEKLKNVHQELNETLEALQVSEESCRTILENLQDAYIRADKDGIIIMASPSAARMYGYIYTDDMLGISSKDFYKNPEDRIHVLDELKKHGKLENNESEVLRKDGTSFLASQNAQFYYDNLGHIKGTETLVRDITERKKVEKKMEYHSLLLNNVQDAIIGADLNFRITYWNKGAEQMYGYTEDEALGKITAFELIRPDYGPGQREKLIENLEDKGTSKLIINTKHRIGTEIIAEMTSTMVTDESGTSTGYVVVYRDITKLKKTEKHLQKLLEQEQSIREELQVSNEQLQSTTEHLQNANKQLSEYSEMLSTIYELNPDAIVLTTFNDSKIIDCNQEYVYQTGYSREELIGHTSIELKLMSLEDRTAYINKTRNNQTINNHEVKVQRKDGSFIRVLYSTKLITVNNEPVVLNIGHDLTERINREEKLEKIMNKLEYSNKELQRFAYVTSHDLREPLRMITSFLQLLERRYADELDEEAHEFIGFAVDGAKRLDAMTKDLLQYSRITSQKTELTNVNFEQVLNEALINLKIPIEENKAVITHDPLPIINGVLHLKVQLFQNIIGNAIKYRSKDTPKIHISATKENSQYLFSIKDNGIGMSHEHLERIFVIFQRLHTHEEHEGTGIGLAIAQKIVHQQGGQIWAESEPGKGSTFYFTIPTL